MRARAPCATAIRSPRRSPRQVDAARRLITLPKMVEWYAHDFSPHSAPLEVAKAVAAMLPAKCEARAQMGALLAARPKPTVRFAPFTWACHPRLREWHPDWRPPA